MLNVVKDMSEIPDSVGIEFLVPHVLLSARGVLQRVILEEVNL